MTVIFSELLPTGWKHPWHHIYGYPYSWYLLACIKLLNRCVFAAIGIIGYYSYRTSAHETDCLLQPYWIIRPTTLGRNWVIVEHLLMGSAEIKASEYVCPSNANDAFHQEPLPRWHNCGAIPIRPFRWRAILGCGLLAHKCKVGSWSGPIKYSFNGKDGWHWSGHNCQKSNKMIDNMPMLIF